MKRINFTLTFIITILTSLTANADFVVNGNLKSPGNFNATTVLAAVILIVVLLILLYVLLTKKKTKTASKK